MNRFQVYKIVSNNRKMHITSIEADDRIDAKKKWRKVAKNAIFGFKFWNYYITGLTQK